MSFEQELQQKIKSTVKIAEPMSLHTTWQVGGPADYYVSPADTEELVQIISTCRKHGIPYYITGNGSNLLVLDGGIRGLVINIGQPFCYVKRSGTALISGAGTPMTLLSKSALDHGLTGLEFAVGIPGSLGGAVIMNAGAFGGYIGDRVTTVRLVTDEGENNILNKSELIFGYRTSNLAEKGVLIEVSLELEKGNPVIIKEKMEEFISERLRRHPRLPSCGSVFRNQPDNPAGRLIEEAGGKGICIGGAEVSSQHANFIVNRGAATAADILAIIKAVQALVKEKHGYELHPEVKIIGEER
jgi:UDP-N-acetylmuramate dehydrogenase